MLEQAIVERRVVRLAYCDKEGTPNDRVVEPLTVVAIEPHWYLTAWCRLREEARVFRLDRIAGATLTRLPPPTP